jgi:hypothetical protein
MSKKLHGSDSSDPGKTDLYGGIILVVATIVALIVANSPLGSRYFALLQTIGEVRVGSLALRKTIEHWINDGLMAIFSAHRAGNQARGDAGRIGRNSKRYFADPRGNWRLYNTGCDVFGG